jgi:hypothetical protein
MADIGEFLAPYRTAIWFDVRGNYLHDMGQLSHILQRLSSQLHWDSISPSKPPVLSVYFGSIVDHQFTLQEVGQEMVWCAMIGAPDAKTKIEIQGILEESKLEELIRLDIDPPPPCHPSYSLILYGLLTHETLIGMEAVSKHQRRYESVIGLEAVYPQDETEVALLTALLGEEALPTLLRLMGRNLRRWINEPKLGPAIDVNRLIQHAYELRHIGAIRAAGVAAGTALEVLMIQWSGIPAEQVRAEKTMLGKLIMKAQKLMKLPDETLNELRAFSNLRAKCAHALVEGSISDDDLLEEVDRFLSWLSKAQVKGTA